jgi:hypothetical protein
MNDHVDAAPAASTDRIKGSGWIALFLSLLIVAVAAIFSFSSGQHPQPAKDATAALAVITGGALAIERIMEFGWTLVGQFIDPTWPSALSSAVAPFIGRLREDLTTYLAEAATKLQSLKNDANADASALARVQQQLAALKTAVTTLAGSPATERLQDVARLAADTTALFERLGAKLQVTEDGIVAAANDASAFIATFSDNPGRRLISIAIGSSMGLVMAAAFPLDVFQATSSGTSNGGASSTPLGIAFTGLIMGLGSNPTHEVIRALQQLKKMRAGG